MQNYNQNFDKGILLRNAQKYTVDTGEANKERRVQGKNPL